MHLIVSVTVADLVAQPNEKKMGTSGISTDTLIWNWINDTRLVFRSLFSHSIFFFNLFALTIFGCSVYAMLLVEFPRHIIGRLLYRMQLAKQTTATKSLWKILKWFFIMCNTRHTTHHCETSSTHIGLISMRLWYERVAMNIWVSVAVEGDVSYFSLSKWWLFKVKFFKQIDLHAYYCVTGLDYVHLWHHSQTSKVCSVHIKVCITACSNQYASNYLMMNSKAPHSTNTWSLCLVLLSAQHPFEA